MAIKIAREEVLIFIISVATFLLLLSLKSHSEGNMMIIALKIASTVNIDINSMPNLELKLLFLAQEYLYDYCTNVILIIAFCFNFIFFRRLKWFANLSLKRRVKEFIFQPVTLRRVEYFCEWNGSCLLVILCSMIKNIFLPLFISIS
jgi:hypothetical protein